jgi:hypothetical protein
MWPMRYRALSWNEQPQRVHMRYAERFQAALPPCLLAEANHPSHAWQVSGPAGESIQLDVRHVWPLQLTLPPLPWWRCVKLSTTWYWLHQNLQSFLDTPAHRLMVRRLIGCDQASTRHGPLVSPRGSEDDTGCRHRDTWGESSRTHYPWPQCQCNQDWLRPLYWCPTHGSLPIVSKDPGRRIVLSRVAQGDSHQD